MSEGRKLFSVGQRIHLTGDHPWSGSSGVIVGPWLGSQRLGLDWEVELDSGDYPDHQVAASEREMRAERRTSRPSSADGAATAAPPPSSEATR